MKKLLIICIVCIIPVLSGGAFSIQNATLATPLTHKGESANFKETPEHPKDYHILTNTNKPAPIINNGGSSGGGGSSSNSDYEIQYNTNTTTSSSSNQDILRRITTPKETTEQKPSAPKEIITIENNKPIIPTTPIKIIEKPPVIKAETTNKKITQKLNTSIFQQPKETTQTNSNTLGIFQSSKLVFGTPKATQCTVVANNYEENFDKYELFTSTMINDHMSQQYLILYIIIFVLSIIVIVQRVFLNQIKSIHSKIDFLLIGKEQLVPVNKPKPLKTKKTVAMVIITLLGFGFHFNTMAAIGEKTGPENIYYQGTLRDDNGELAQGTMDFRFSIWNKLDFETNDVVSGEINTSATGYLQWNETQSQEITHGYFSFALGEIINIPDDVFKRNYTYLQVEVKNSTTSNDQYEFIDINPSNPTEDRIRFNIVPYAKNADLLDFHELGFDPDQIPFLDENGNLPSSVIPTSSDKNYFQIGKNTPQTNPENIQLFFGQEMEKFLGWNGILQQFKLSDTLTIDGDLFVTGNINGISLGIRNRIETLSPGFKNAVFVGDGANNSGSMYEHSEILNGKSYQFYQWETREIGLQDYDIQIKYKLPDSFISFDELNPISITYKTDGTVDQSKLDFFVFKDGEANQSNILKANTSENLFSNIWKESQLAFRDGTSWQPEDTLILLIRMSATNTQKSKLSEIKLKYQSQ